MTDLNYTPISCSYYDHLEAIATKRTESEIVFLVPKNPTEQKLVGFIDDLYAKEKIEYLVFYTKESKETIRLDRLKSINGIPNPSFVKDQHQDLPT
ncbi:MAG: Rho-binding antiterminator [Rhodothermales bacterium]